MCEGNFRQLRVQMQNGVSVNLRALKIRGEALRFRDLAYAESRGQGLGLRLLGLSA